MRLLRATLLAAIVLCVGAPSALCGAGWEPYGAWQVRRTVGVPARDPKQPKMRGLDCCTVSFPTATFLQPDGRDLRVAIAGKPAPFQIVDIAYGGVVCLVAGLEQEASTLEVYYGNPAAEKLKTDWEPQRGLWMETRAYKGGDCQTLRGMQDALAKSGERFGRGPAAQIHQGYNLFGPSDNYLSVYKGWFYLPKDTKVNFAVAADDIAYLFVEDRMVASKTKWGDMPSDQRFASEPLLLKEGIHPITMYHVEATGDQVATAAWWMPGMPSGQKYLHYQVIPDSAFAPLRHGRLLEYEVRGKALGVDFSALNAGDVLLDDAAGPPLLVRFDFRDTSWPADLALKCQPLWDFGDGTTSAARDPSHVYLRPGDYTVTLTLTRGDAVASVVQKVRVGPGWQRAAARQWDSLANYYPILKDYQFDKMATADLLIVTRVFETLDEAGALEAAEKPAKPEDAATAEATPPIVRVGRVLYGRGDQLDDRTFVHLCLLLGRQLREMKGQAQEALRVFARAEQRTKDIHEKARLANEEGDVYLYFLGDLDKAEREYTKTLTTYVKAADAQVRVAQMRLGDVYRARGDHDAALKAYERAAEMPIHNRSETVEAARRGSFPRTAEDYTQRKLFKEAHEALNDWDWEFPTDKLVGYSTLLRARLAVAEGKPEEAIKQANELVRANRDSEYADDLLLSLADTHLAAGELDKALAAVARLLKDYPASDLQEEAKLKRVEILLKQGKLGDAATEGLDFAKERGDSDKAPKALLLAATAQMRQKKNADAIQTLERLTKKYPTSSEYTAAIKFLKELRQR